MPKIVLFCSTLDRLGPTNVIYNMLQAYYKNKSDFDFTIVTLSPEPKTTRKRDFEDLGIKIFCLNIKRGLDALFHLKKIKCVIEEMQPDICHSYGYRADVIMSLLPLNNVVKVSSLFNNPFEDYPMLFGNFKGYLMAKSHVFVLRGFRNVITCSKFIAEQLAKYKLPLSIIYTGVPSNCYIPLDPSEKIERKKKLNISSDCKVYIFIANLIPRKNPAFLVKIFSDLKIPNTILLMMGDGELMKECREICDDENIVRYLGKQSGTLKYLQISDYYISPSFSEGFPTAVLEAMSVGLTPILSNIKPHAEMLNGVDNPLLFSLKSLTDLSLILESTSINSTKFDYRKYLENNFSADVMQQKYILLYKLLIGQKL